MIDEVDFYLIDLKSRFDKIKPNTYYLSYSGGKDSHFLYWFIKDYLNYFHISKIDIRTVFHIFKARIKCWKQGHNYSFCCKTGNSYVSVCKKCGKQSVLTLMDDNKLFHN